MQDKPSILFLSTHDSARGLMAEALFRVRAGDRYRVLSAGLFPKEMNPMTRRVLEEVGIETTRLAPRNVREFMARTPVQVAVILGDGGPASPKLYPFAPKLLHWHVENPDAGDLPEAERVERFRRVREIIRARIEEWLAGTDAIPAKTGFAGEPSSVAV